jgi:uncharacterized protein YjbJ (UPF0337 family)
MHRAALTPPRAADGSTMSGSTGDKIKGKANEVAGKVTGKRSKQAKGKGQQAKGGVKDKVAQKDRELREKSGDEEF